MNRPTTSPRSLMSTGVGAVASGDVEGGETAVAPDEAVRRPAGVHEVAHDITTIVDAGGQGVHGVGCVDPGGLAPVTDVAAHSGAVVDERGVLAVAAHDLAAIVDLDRLGSPGAGHIERGDPAARVPHEPGLAVGSDVLTGDVAAVVDAAREDLDPGVRRLELAVPTLSEDEPRRGAARPVRGRRTHRRPGRRERGGGGDRSREDACDTVGAAPAAEPRHDGTPFRSSGCLDSRVFGAGRHPGSSENHPQRVSSRIALDPA